jgi:hypothetical protein
MIATPIANAIQVRYKYLLENVWIIEVAYDGSTLAYFDAPNAITCEGVTCAKSSHNSDTFTIVYRSDKKFAIDSTK